jgi:hypothetical protein
MRDMATKVIKNAMIVDPNRLRLVIARVDAVQGTEPGMDEAVLCKLADAVSQYARP